MAQGRVLPDAETPVVARVAVERGMGAQTTATGRSLDMAKPFGDGIWRIGKDIVPGTYAAPGGESCLWNSLSGFTSGINDILRLSHKGRPIVTLEDTYRGFRVVGFQTFGCGRWRPIADITEPVESIGDGTWLVGQEIAPGTYAASEICFWSRLKRVQRRERRRHRSGVEDKPIVTIEPTDAGFMSRGCGKWTRVE